MDNNDLFKALSSKTRINIIKTLGGKELHISELSRILKISKPVISRHIKLLEKTSILKRRIIGNVHLISVNPDCLEKIFDPFISEYTIDIKKNETIFDALKQLPDVEIRDYGKNKQIISIGGEKGFYIYDVNGITPDKPIDEFKPREKVTINLKKLVSIDKKKIKINLRNKDPEK